MIDPLPASEKSDSPMMFLAWMIAHTLEPHGKLNGELVKTEMGTWHVLVLITVKVAPSQYAPVSLKVTPSACLTLTVYPLIAEPPSVGKVQVICTLSFTNDVTGAEGWSGTVAAMIANAEEA